MKIPRNCGWTVDIIPHHPATSCTSRFVWNMFVFPQILIAPNRLENAQRHKHLEAQGAGKRKFLTIYMQPQKRNCWEDEAACLSYSCAVPYGQWRQRRKDTSETAMLVIQTHQFEPNAEKGQPRIFLSVVVKEGERRKRRRQIYVTRGRELGSCNIWCWFPFRATNSGKSALRQSPDPLNILRQH